MLAKCHLIQRPWGGENIATWQNANSAASQNCVKVNAYSSEPAKKIAWQNFVLWECHPSGSVRGLLALGAVASEETAGISS